jgi:hypothetical protein
MKLMNKPNIRFERGFRFSRNLALVFGLYLIERQKKSVTTQTFPHNEPLNFTEYCNERPEMTSHGGKPRKAKTIKKT